MTNVRLTGLGTDGGIDVESDQAVAQVKAQAKPVGRPVLQAIFGVGSALGKRSVVFGLAGFTPAASTFASSNGIALFSFDLDGNVTAVNPPARTMTTGTCREAAQVSDDYLGDCGTQFGNARRSRMYPQFESARALRAVTIPLARGALTASVGHGVAYFNTAGGLVGRPLSGHTQSVATSQPSIGSAPLIAECRMISTPTGFFGDQLLCVDAATGVTQWSRDVPEGKVCVTTDQSCVGADALYVGVREPAEGGRDAQFLESFGFATGRPRWRAEVPNMFGRIAAGDGVVAMGDVALAALGDRGNYDLRAKPFGFLRVFDSSSGARLWALDDFAVETLHVSGGTVLVLGAVADPWFRGLFAFDAFDGTPLWRKAGARNLASSPNPYIAVGPPSLAATPTSVWVFDAIVAEHDLRSGELLHWSKTPAGFAREGILIGGDVGVVAHSGDSSSLVLMSGIDGSVLDELPIVGRQCPTILGAEAGSILLLDQVAGDLLLVS